MRGDELRAATWYRDTRSANEIALLQDRFAVIASGRVDSVYRDAAAADKIARKVWVLLGEEP